MKRYWVYIMSNRYGNVLYVGVTNDIERRVAEHRSGRGGRFTRRYRVCKLLHAEPFSDVHDALRREKQLKGWRRAKKLALVQRHNPEFSNLLRQENPVTGRPN